MLAGKRRRTEVEGAGTRKTNKDLVDNNKHDLTGLGERVTNWRSKDGRKRQWLWRKRKSMRMKKELICIGG